MTKIARSLWLVIAGLLVLSAPLLANAPFTNPPSIGSPVTLPAKPSTTDPVTVKVNVTEAHPGVMNVSIVYTTDAWHSVNITVPATYNSTLRTWTATIPALASGGHVEFYIVSFDFNDNKAVNNNSGTYYTYDVAGTSPPPGSLIPTSTSGWLVEAVILGGIGAFALFLVRSTRHRPSRAPHDFHAD